MRKWFALAALCALLVSIAPAMGEAGNNSSPRGFAAQLEHKRQLDAVGGITASPYWLKQGFLCGRSISLRLFEVEKPVLPNQLLFKERLRYAQDGSGSKELLLTIKQDTPAVELRVGSDALSLMKRADISRVIVRNNRREVIQVYECSDVQSVFDFFGFEEGEVLCLLGEENPMFAHDPDGVRRVIIQ